ncbi:hypothetical protein EPIR_0133 [Erwinia piriflorinigrans CFBP 5888]|uniref:Uncharacterized protein n=1 Tax=Erwinia piriflorinigrans CFBP 5888 TaxID=1161919 RepID=V5Z3H8_9GAMM|nr:hypothetical protein EPIR_0133 [Erwinia piriflorinigrans CFBP 5888]
MRRERSQKQKDAKTLIFMTQNTFFDFAISR